MRKKQAPTAQTARPVTGTRANAPVDSSHTPLYLLIPLVCASMDHGIHFCFSKLCLYSRLASIPATLMKTSCTGMEISCLVQETSPSLHNQKNPFLSSVQVFCISQEHHWLHLNDDFCLEEMPWLAPLAVFEFSAAKSLCAFLSGALQGKLSGRLHPGACQTRFKPRCRRRSPKQ